MPASEQISRLAPYARQLLDDDYVQGELDRLFSTVREGTHRAKGKSATEVATDRQLRAHMTIALAAAGHIARAMKSPEPAPPKRHRLRTLTLTVAVAGAAYAGYRQLSADG